MRPVLAFAAVMLMAMPAFAGDPAVDAQAERLFDDGRALIGQGRYREACVKFLASDKTSPSGGAILNLADCYEKAGKLASAWSSFKEAETRARLSRHTDIEEHAHARALSLAAQLSTVTIVVTPENDLPGLTVTRDETAIDRAAWGTALPVDAGSSSIVAEAPGHLPWKTTVEVGGPGGSSRVVSIPLLPAIAAPPPALPPSWTSRPSVRIAAATTATVLGVAGIGMGSALGLIAMHDNNEAGSACPHASACPTLDGPSLTSSARSAATASTVSFVAGGVFAAAAVALWVTLPRGPRVTVGVKGMELTGSF
jgi:hypothetical protein